MIAQSYGLYKVREKTQVSLYSNKHWDLHQILYLYHRRNIPFHLEHRNLHTSQRCLDYYIYNLLLQFLLHHISHHQNLLDVVHKHIQNLRIFKIWIYCFYLFNNFIRDYKMPTITLVYTPFDIRRIYI